MTTALKDLPILEYVMRKDEVVISCMSLVAWKTRFLLRFVHWLAFDEAAEPQPRIEAYLLEFVTMI